MLIRGIDVTIYRCWSLISEVRVFTFYFRFNSVARVVRRYSSGDNIIDYSELLIV